jgi:4'-phosphopantetheinyl transferase EntD
VLATLLPAAVAAAEAFGDLSGVALFPAEEAALAGSVERRRREFTTVRHCAREAMSRLGVPAAPVLRGERGAPVWPAGVVGSLTHCEGYRAAAVGLRDDVSGIGIDAEPHVPLPRGLLPAVARVEEMAALRALAEVDPSICWDRLLFCCKEAVYKSWFPLTRVWLEFHDARVRIAPVTGTFSARVRTDGRAGDLQGRWCVRDGLLVAAVSLLPGHPLAGQA